MSSTGPGAHRDYRAEFELNVSIPRDPRFAETVRMLAEHAARQGGCSDARAHAFGREVEEAARGHIEDDGAEAGLPLVFRRATGPVEVLVNGRTLYAEP
jgi:hypothetical protein